MATRYQIEVRLIATSGPDHETGGGRHTAYVRTHETAGPQDIHTALAMVDWLAQTDVDRRTETVDCPGCEGVVGECVCVVVGDGRGYGDRTCGICDTVVTGGKCGTFEVVRK